MDGPFSFVGGSIIQMLEALVLLVLASIIVSVLISRMMKTKKMFCTCGQELNKTDNFCPRCGRKLQQ
jgi:predicted amidophosphoribosyltransferase